MATLPVGDAWQKGNEEDISEIRDCFCPNCHAGHATSLMLPTKVPGFREIIVVTLMCPDCNFRNSEVTFGGEIQPQGSTIELKVQDTDELNRQVLKSDSAILKLPTLDLEIPANTQRGVLTTIEGILSRTEENLSALQPERLRLGDVENFHRCQAVIDKIKRVIGTGDDDDEEEEPVFPFSIILDDPAGNSFIENPHAPQPDPHLTTTQYSRTPTQDMALGLQPSKEAVEAGTIDDNNPKHKNATNEGKPHTLDIDENKAIGRQEVLKFPTTCTHCYKPAETDMCVTDIPHFKEVIIMSMVCEHCGFKSNEIKGGGAIPNYGSRITLSVNKPADLGREVLKSDTAGIAIPELELQLEEGGLDGVYTTVEGLLDKIRDRLEKANPFGSGDAAVKQHLSNDGGAFSAPDASHERFQTFLQNLRDMSAGKRLPFTLEIRDPLANSFVGPVPEDALALSLQAEKEDSKACYEGYVDAGMQLEEFERTFEQNESLGLNDIKTEGYGHSEYYGTDRMQEVPDRIKRIDVRGPDHPHEVGMAPVEGDTTVMGPGSANFSVPSIGQRGTRRENHEAVTGVNLQELLKSADQADESFTKVDQYDGRREGMAFKAGVQGLGYYKDVPLLKLCQEKQAASS